MDKCLLLVFPMFLVLSACGKEPQAPDQATTAPSTPVATQAPASTSTPAPPVRASKTRLAEIRAAARRGLWSDSSGLCSANRASLVVTWNVADSGARHTELFLLGSDQPRLVSRGGTVGEIRTGRWVRAGMSFVLRDADNGDEIAQLPISKPSC